MRVDNCLIVPEHVYSSCSERPTVRGVKTGKLVELTGKPYYVIDTDMLAVELSEAEVSSLGLAKPRIQHFLAECGTLAKIVGPEKKGTTGFLVNDSQLFGRVVYGGTTMGGYSGAAYMIGSCLAGFHTSGGSVNGGFSASYIYATLCALRKVVPEDSSEWLANEFQLGKKIRIDRSWQDLDDIRVQVGGRYAVVARSALDKALGREWRSGDDQYITRKMKPECKPEVASTSVVPAKSSGESSRTNTPGGSSVSEETQDSVLSDLQMLIRESKTVSLKKLKQIRNLLKSSEQETVDTAGPTAAPAISTA